MATGTEVDRIFVGLGMDASQFNKALETSTEKLNSWGKSMQRAGMRLTQGLTAPIGVAAGALLGLTERSAKYAETVEKAAAQSGMAASEIQEIAFAASTVSGVRFEQVQDGLKELAIRATEAAEGTGEAQEAFERLGISQQEIQSMNQAQLFRRVREEMQSLTKAQRILTSEQIFGGEAGEQFAEVMSLSATQMGKLRKEAQKSGAVLGSQQIDKLDALREQYNRMISRAKGLGVQLGASLVPVIRTAVLPALNAMIEWARDFSQWFGSLSTTTKTWIGIIAGTAAAIGPALVALGTLSTLLSGLPAVFSAVATAATSTWAAITGPVGLVVGAIAAVAGGAWIVVNNWEAVSTFFSDLFSGLIKMAQGFKDGFMGVWKLVMGQVTSLVLKGMREILEGVQMALESLGIDRFVGSVDSALSTLESGITRSQTAVSRGADLMSDSWDQISGGAMEFGRDVADVAGQVKDSVVDMVTFTKDETGGMFDTEGMGPGQVIPGGGGSGGGGQGGGGGQSGFTTPEWMKAMDELWAGVKKDVDKSKQKMVEWGQVGKRATDRVSRGLGRMISNLITGQSEVENLGDVFDKIGNMITRLLQQIIQQIITTIVKTLVLKAIAGIASGGAGAAIPAGGGVPFGGATVASAPAGGAVTATASRGAGLGLNIGSATLAQGKITQSVEIVSQAKERGDRQRSETGRKIS